MARVFRDRISSRRQGHAERGEVGAQPAAGARRRAAIVLASGISRHHGARHRREPRASRPATSITTSPTKKSIFRSLLDEFWRITETRRYPFTRALSVGQFPDNIEQLGLAARESIREFKPYFALIFVDVIEFEGTHIRKFYGELGKRYGAFVGEEALGAMRQRLRPSVSAIDALLITARVFFNYFTIEILFNVPEPFGKEASQSSKSCRTSCGMGY